MPSAIVVDKEEVQLALGQFGATLSDRDSLLRICGELMRTSIARTFREEGSPAGSWPELAASTRKKKGYTSGHKLLILSGRLFNSITYVIAAGVLTIGTDVVYAAVQQLGSRDYAAGPRTLAQHQAKAAIGPYAGLRRTPFRRYGQDSRLGKDGKTRTVRVRAQGPDNAKRFQVSAHSRHQNIPPRPFLVFRPEDPNRMILGIDAYLRGKAVRIGKVGAA
jgi:phage virion morphogenesis protein